MRTSLKDYKNLMLDAMLGFLWRQWSSLGVPGHGGETHRHFVDPEAALALLCSCGRNEARLFDEVLDWLVKYGRLVNVQRLRTIMAKEPFTGAPVLAGVARFLARATRQNRWEPLIPAGEPVGEPMPLFVGRDGRPLPVLGDPDPDFLRAGLLRGPVQLRGHASFHTKGKGPTLVRLRALLGLNARCEILLYLMTHPVGYPRQIAADIYYAQKTVHDSMDDMALSGYLRSIKGNRERLCRLESRELAKALLGGNASPEWVKWPRVLGTFDRTWTALNSLTTQELDPLLELSQARAVAESFITDLHGENAVPELSAPQTNDLAGCWRPIKQALKLLAG